jgi:hypothetical protein
MILVPVIPVLLWGVYLIVKKNLHKKYVKIFFIFSLIIVTGFIWFFLEFVAPVGFGERMFFIAQMLLALLSAVCIIELVQKIKFKTVVYLLFAVFFVGVVVISPITNRSDYALVYYGPMTVADSNLAHFVVAYSIDGQSLTGDGRLASMVDVFGWPNSLRFSQEFLNNVKNGDSAYSVSQVIVVNPATPVYLTVQGATGLDAANYVAGLYNTSDVVYVNGYDAAFVPK